MRAIRLVILTILVCLATRPVDAAHIAIIQGEFYTDDLYQALLARGLDVTRVKPGYTLESLSAYDTVVDYGNSSADLAILEDYVINGGQLVETPWFWLLYNPSGALQIFSNSEGGDTSFSEQYPGVEVLEPTSPLLSGVSFPTLPTDLQIGRTLNNTFEDNVTQIAKWSDGTAFIGAKTVGDGTLIGINMHVITSDTAYKVINEPWATQLLANAVDNTVDFHPVDAPEPSSLALLALGGVGAMFAGNRRRRSASTHCG